MSDKDMKMALKVGGVDGTFGRAGLEVARIVDERTACECMADMDLLHAYLVRLHMYEEKVCEFAALECEMWLRIADTVKDPTTEHFKKGEVAIIRWLHGKGADERAEILETCRRDGINVKGQKLAEDRERRSAERFELAMSNLECCVDEAVDEVMRKGMGVLSLDSVRQRMSERDFMAIGGVTVQAYVERGRDELLNQGAVGLADRMGTYIVPDKARTDQMRQAVDQRIQGAIADIRRVTNLIREYDVAISTAQVHLLQDAASELMRRLVDAADRRVA